MKHVMSVKDRGSYINERPWRKLHEAGSFEVYLERLLEFQ